MTIAAKSIDVLNRLVGHHASSLASYLADARPWSAGESASRVMSLFDQIARDHLRIVERAGKRIIDLGGVSQNIHSYPMEYTSLHDVSVDFLSQKLAAYEANLQVLAQACAEQLSHDAESQSIANEAVGMAQGHLDLLRETQVHATGA